MALAKFVSDVITLFPWLPLYPWINLSFLWEEQKLSHTRGKISVFGDRSHLTRGNLKPRGAKSWLENTQQS